MPVFVGVDPSITNTGIIILDCEGTVLGHLNTKSLFSTKDKKDKKFVFTRLGRIADGVTKFIKSVSNNAYVAYENYSYNSVNKAFTTGELGGILKYSLLMSLGNLLLVEPTKLKKFSTKIGTATKEFIIAQALKESKYFGALSKKELTDDICDAYFLAKFAWYAHNPEQAIAKDSESLIARSRLALALTQKKGDYYYE